MSSVSIGIAALAENKRIILLELPNYYCKHRLLARLEIPVKQIMPLPRLGLLDWQSTMLCCMAHLASGWMQCAQDTLLHLWLQNLVKNFCKRLPVRSPWDDWASPRRWQEQSDFWPLIPPQSIWLGTAMMLMEALVPTQRRTLDELNIMKTLNKGWIIKKFSSIAILT